MSTGMKLLLDSARGIYIPINFAQDFDRKAWGLRKTDITPLLQGPKREWYWDAWDAVLNKAQHKDERGNVWRLHQDGDLWAVCPELMSDEEYENFFGETRDKTEQHPMQKISLEDIVEEMKSLQNSDDPQDAHHRADALLCLYIESIGAVELVEAFKKVPRYYA